MHIQVDTVKKYVLKEYMYTSLPHLKYFIELTTTTLSMQIYHQIIIKV